MQSYAVLHPCITLFYCFCSWQGPRMVRDVFRLAKENSPSIIFIDEVDAIATARFDAQTGADREVQRILMELLNQMDGFDQTVNVKVRAADLCLTCLTG
jgi:ATP-dependent 26S proteasome regulatory subunit